MRLKETMTRILIITVGKKRLGKKKGGGRDREKELKKNEKTALNEPKGTLFENKSE